MMEAIMWAFLPLMIIQIYSHLVKRCAPEIEVMRF